MNTKRIAATILWFVGGWILGSMVLFALGLSTAIAPVVGLAFAALIFADPAGLLWPRPRREARLEATQEGTAAAQAR